MSFDFPLKEMFVDCTGVERHFKITTSEIGETGKHAVYAKEISDSTKGGYEFMAIDSSIYHAIGDLRKKIRRALRVKYLSKDPSYSGFSSDSAIGRISHNGIVIDGKLITFEKFCNILTTYEGFQIEILIKDPSES